MTISILITPLIWLCSSDFSWVSGPYIKLLPWLFTVPQNKCFQNWTYCLCLNPFPKPFLHLPVVFFKCSVLWMETSLTHLAPGGNVAIISDFTFCITWIFNTENSLFHLLSLSWIPAPSVPTAGALLCRPGLCCSGSCSCLLMGPHTNAVSLVQSVSQLWPESIPVPGFHFRALLWMSCLQSKGLNSFR